MESCAFCGIVKKQLPGSVVYEDEQVIALMDVQPVNPGHVLVIPRAHKIGLSDLDEETGTHMFQVAMRVANAVKKSGVKCEGVSLMLADGAAAFQEIFHVHLHVIPRFRGDGFRLSFGQKYGIRPERKELDETAQRIRSVLR